MKDKKIQECLLGERTPLGKAIKIVVSMKSTRKYLKLMQETPTSETETLVHRFPERCECYRCGSTTYLVDKYQFKNKECFKCWWIGHAQWKCRQEEDRPPCVTTHNGKRRTVNNVDVSDVEEREVNMEKLDLLLLFSRHHLY